MLDIMLSILDGLSLLLSIFGVFLVIYGALLAMYRIIVIEFGQLNQRFRRYEDAKRIFIQKLIFALDFFVAADILKLVIRPSSTEELFVIGGIVAIRTILSFFLSKEVHLHKE
ncbi:MAG: DUF1622 domain-containing protein [Candidatus Micrarchaeota archaeon]